MSENSLTRGTIFATVLFAVSIVIGVGFVNLNPGFGEEVMSLFNDQVVGQILSDSQAILAFKIFLNNLTTCVLLFLGGASLGLVTMLILSVNGLLIGVVTELVRAQQGALYIVAALVPHGIFEIPAVLISGGLGFLLARAIISEWHGLGVFEIPAVLISGGLGFLLARAIISEWHGLGDAAAEARSLARIFLRVVFPLLLVAAVVEAFITPAILIMVA